MSSEVEICNAALSHLGERRILNLSEDTEEAKICSARFNPCRKAVLEMYPWGFASDRIVSAPVVTAPAFQYTYKHKLPSDFIRVISLYEYDGDWTIEKGHLLCDTDTLQLIYVYDFTDMGATSPLFAEALGFYLAFNIAKTITESDQDRQTMNDAFERVLSRAKFVQSGEHHLDIFDDDTLTSARRGSSYVRDPMT